MYVSMVLSFVSSNSLIVHISNYILFSHHTSPLAPSLPALTEVSMTAKSEVGSVKARLSHMDLSTKSRAHAPVLGDYTEV